MFEIRLDESDQQNNLFASDGIKTELFDTFEAVAQPVSPSPCFFCENPKQLKIHGYECRLLDFHHYNRTSLTEEDVVARLAQKYDARVFERFLDLCRETALRKSGKRLLRSNKAQTKWILNIVFRSDVSCPQKFRFQSYWESFEIGESIQATFGGSCN